MSRPTRMRILLPVALAIALLVGASGLNAATASTPAPPAAPHADHAHVAGVYATDADAGGRGMTLRVYALDGVLLGRINDNAPTRLLPKGGPEFHPEAAPGFTLRFEGGTDAASSLVLTTPEGTMRLARVAAAAADPAASGALFDELAAMDARLFDAVFVACDPTRVQTMLIDDIEFVHDKTGFSRGAEVHEAFRRQTENCPGRNGIRREVVDGSLRVYPIDGYGAVQAGEHRFIERGASHYTHARFTTLWQRHTDGWKVARALSYDHQSLPAPAAPSPRR